MSDCDLELEDRLEELEAITKRGLEVLANRCGMDGEAFIVALETGGGIEREKP